MNNKGYDIGDRVLVIMRHGTGFRVVERELLQRRGGGDDSYLVEEDDGRRNFVDEHHIIKRVGDL